jgi:uncharacterized protein YdeI (YjbR/CyaY-like superfamily)
MPTPSNIQYFKTPAELRTWFAKNHHKLQEQWIGYYKKDSGTPSITWQESVDQALCFGWIDGIRKSIDAKRYTIRFTPRKPTSIWSAINIKRVGELKKLGLMKKPGLEIFENRDIKKANQYSFEQRQHPTLSPLMLKTFKANKKAWNYFSCMPPGYQKTATWWVISAKQESTVEKRLQQLISDSEHERTIPPLTRKR